MWVVPTPKKYQCFFFHQGVQGGRGMEAPEKHLKQIGEYRMMRDLGEGTFGKVKLGIHVRTK